MSHGRARNFTVLLVALISISLALSLTPAGRVSAADSRTLGDSFPDRKTSSSEARSLLDYLAGQLQAVGWFTDIMPYSKAAVVTSHRENRVVVLRTDGENLLALPEAGPTRLHYLLVAPYDNMYADIPGSPIQSSSTAISAQIALDVGRLEDARDADFGIAFVSGHYQFNVGMEALLEHLELRSIRVDHIVILGDVIQSKIVPIVSNGKAPSSMLRALESAMEETGVGTWFASDWALDILQYPRAESESPECLWGVESAGEHAIVDKAGASVITLGYPSSDLTVRLGPSGQDSVLIASKTGAIALSLGEFLATYVEPEASLHSQGTIFRFLGRTHLLGGGLATAGLIASAAFILAALFLIRKNGGTPTATVGTSAAAAISLLLGRALYTNPQATNMGRILAGTTLSITLYTFIALMLLGSLRMWSTRSRIELLHLRHNGESAQGPVKTSWATGWPFLVMSTLSLVAFLTKSELAPSLLLAAPLGGLGAALLILPKNQPPSTARLWLARLLYLGYLPAVFWAGSPFTPEAQVMYRASWWGANAGALVSLLAAGCFAASIMATISPPRPMPAKILRWALALEIVMLLSVIGLAVLVPGRLQADIPSWVRADETYGRYNLMGDPYSQLGITCETPPAGLTLSRKSLPPSTTWATAGLRYVAPDPELPTNFGWAADVEFEEMPTAIAVYFEEVIPTRAQALGYSLIQIDPEFGAFDNPLQIRPGYSLILARWMPLMKDGSLVQRYTSARALRAAFRAFYLDQSYGDIEFTAGDRRVYFMTSVVDR